MGTFRLVLNDSNSMQLENDYLCEGCISRLEVHTFISPRWVVIYTSLHSILTSSRAIDVAELAG